MTNGRWGLVAWWAFPEWNGMCVRHMQREIEIKGIFLVIIRDVRIRLKLMKIQDKISHSQQLQYSSTRHRRTRGGYWRHDPWTLTLYRIRRMTLTATIHSYRCLSLTKPDDYRRRRIRHSFQLAHCLIKTILKQSYHHRSNHRCLNEVISRGAALTQLSLNQSLVSIDDLPDTEEPRWRASC